MNQCSLSPLFLFSDTFYDLGSSLCDFLASNNHSKQIYCVHRGSPRVYKKLRRKYWLTELFYTYRYEYEFCSNNQCLELGLSHFAALKSHFLELHSLDSLHHLYFSDRRLSFYDFSDHVMKDMNPFLISSGGVIIPLNLLSFYPYHLF